MTFYCFHAGQDAVLISEDGAWITCKRSLLRCGFSLFFFFFFLPLMTFYCFRAGDAVLNAKCTAGCAGGRCPAVGAVLLGRR